MIVLNKQKDKEEICKKINISIIHHEQKSTIFMNNLNYKDELIGDVNENGFWIQKTTFRLFRGPSRIFYGKVISENNGSKIIGKFKFAKFYRIIMNIWHILLSFLLLYQYACSLLSLNQFMILLIALNLFFEMLLYINILFYRNEEKSVVDFLEKL